MIKWDQQGHAILGIKDSGMILLSIVLIGLRQYIRVDLFSLIKRKIEIRDILTAALRNV